MGRVYLARQLDLGRHVVVKVMHEHLAADPAFCERFQRETLLMARFQHPYAVTLLDASVNDPEGPCIIMEFVRGVTLAVLAESNGGRLGPARVGRLLSQLCEALHAAHAAGIVHRDLKPANLMVVDPDTPYEKIKVMDFGLAQLVEPEHRRDGTGPEFAVGTPTYICPEQIQGQELDHRADLYSVGVILYELLAGQSPFGVTSTMELLLAHATEEPRPFPREGAGALVPRAVEDVVLTCLAKNPSDRPASARELAERFAAALTSSDPDSVPELTLPNDAEAEPSMRPAVSDEFDVSTITYRLEAWMPEAIAVHKLKGFMEDIGGDVVENTPGHIRVHLGGTGSAYEMHGAPRSWLRFGRKTGRLEMDLRMKLAHAESGNRLTIKVVMRSLEGFSPLNARWRAFTDQVFCDLRGYLLGQTEEVRA
jgi:serine/threonine-protein kinase